MKLPIEAWKYWKIKTDVFPVTLHIFERNRQQKQMQIKPAIDRMWHKKFVCLGLQSLEYWVFHHLRMCHSMDEF